MPRDVLDNAMHAEEAADLLDTRECGLEASNDKGEHREAEEPGRLPPDQHHSASQENQPDFDRQRGVGWNANVEPHEGSSQRRQHQTGATLPQKPTRPACERAGHCQQRSQDQDGILGDAVEHVRCDQPGEDAADHTAE